jgi:hypothetical protein
MISQAKIAAARSNGRKSRAPRPRAGKSSSRLNALRHGLYAATPQDMRQTPTVARIAKGLRADDPSPVLYEQAVEVAHYHALLARVRAARVAAIEKQLSAVRQERQARGGGEHAAQFDEATAFLRAPLERLERMERQVWRSYSRAIETFTATKCLGVWEKRQHKVAAL